MINFFLRFHLKILVLCPFHEKKLHTELEVKTPNCFSRKLMYFLICLLLMIMVTSFFYIYNNRIQQKYKKRRQKLRFLIQIVVWLKFFLKSMHSFFKKTKSFFLDSIWGGKEAGGHFFLCIMASKIFWQYGFK